MTTHSMLTAAELAAHLRTSERTVARLVADGCPSLKVRGRRIFDLATVLTWLAEAEACRSEETLKATGTPRLASAVVAFTDACRRVQVRATPSN